MSKVHAVPAIRFARLDDAAAICAIHRSHQDRWYRQFENEQVPVSCEALSLDELWGFGGPWMSAETCAIHLNNLLLNRALPYVAEIDGEAVAAMEIFSGREGLTYGKNAHVGLLYVHKTHIDRGLGRALVAHALRVAREQGCDTLTVAALPANEAFYRKCGFTDGDTLVKAEVATGHFDGDVVRLPQPPNPAGFTAGMTMAVGRLQSSAFHSFELTDRFALPGYANIERRTYHVLIAGKPALIALCSSAPGQANVSAWTAGTGIVDLIRTILSLLHEGDIRIADTLMSKDDHDQLPAELAGHVKGSRKTLIRPLKERP